MNQTTETAERPANGTETETQASAIARRPLEFELANVDDAWRMASMLAKSNLIPDALVGKPSDVLVTLLTGRELGLSPMQSLRLIYVVKGRPYVSAQLKIAMVKRSPECVYLRCVETSVERATFETERRGEGKTTLTFTADEARAAQLLGRQTKSGEPDNWTKYTATMLRWRAASALCDMVYPDVVGGIGTEDEYQEVLRSERAQKTYAPPPPPTQPKQSEKVVGSGSTAKAPAPAASPAPASSPSAPIDEQPPPHDPVTGEVPDDHDPEPPPEAFERVNVPASPKEQLKAEMRARVEANDLSGLTALARRVREFAEVDQMELTATYTECRNALRERAAKGGAR